VNEVFNYPHTVGVEEIDEQGHANNVAYVAWMQDAALAHSAAVGWTSERYRQLGMTWVARRHEIEYLRPALPGDRIVVQTHVAEMKKVTSTRRYRIIRARDGELLARAETNWAFINSVTGRPTRIPEEMAQAFIETSFREIDSIA